MPRNGMWLRNIVKVDLHDKNVARVTNPSCNLRSFQEYASSKHGSSTKRNYTGVGRRAVLLTIGQDDLTPLGRAARKQASKQEIATLWTVSCNR